MYFSSMEKYNLHLLLNQSPFVRMFVPMALGIVLFLKWPTTLWMLPCALTVCCLLAYIGFYNIKDALQHKYAYTKGILVTILFFSSGYTMATWHAIPSSSAWYKHQQEKYSYAVLRINSELEPKAKTYKTTADVKQLTNASASISTTGEVILYFQKTDSIPALEEGDFILVRNVMKDIQSTHNPGSFDYSAYCKTKNIHQSAYLKSSDWRKLPQHEGSFAGLFLKANKHTRSILKQYITDPSTLGIAEALLIGYRKDVDQETWQAYSNTGIVHIIAISGLHMAMVYASVRWLLLLIPFIQRKKNIAILSALLFMWGFAALTGLPPSVARAAVMFTFIGVGEMTNRSISIYNNLAASAFALLCINPTWISDVGFQLSYIALLSIVLFYEKIYQWFYFSFKPFDLIWKLIAGTLSAQILTFPLCIYYFHQFPILFLLTNLIAVPASTIILYLEIVLVLFSWLTPLATILGQVVSWLIVCLNKIVFQLGQLSFAVWNGLDISFFQFMVLMLFVIFTAIWLMYKNTKMFIYSITTLSVFIVSMLLTQWQVVQQKKMIVYSANKTSYLQFVDGQSYFSPDEHLLAQDPLLQLYTQKPALTALHLNQIDSSIVTYRAKTCVELALFHGLTILRLHTAQLNIPSKLSVDYLIISSGFEAKESLKLSNLNPKQIVIDSSIPFWKTEQLKTTLAAHFQVPIHTVNEDGAFILEL